MTSLNIEGVTAVSLLLPMLQASAPYSYWKFYAARRLNLLLEFFKCYSAGIHTYREGVIALLKIIHKYPNKRDKSFEEWVGIVNAYFDKLEAGLVSGHQLIQVQKGRGDLSDEQIA